MRIHSHYLANVLGAHNCTPLPNRTCPMCASKSIRIQEDETHFMLACPEHAVDRQVLNNKLNELYPLYEQRTRTLTPTEHTKWLLWHVPDGRLPVAHHPSTTADKARVAATHAVLKFLRKAAYRHPHMNRMVFSKDSCA